MGDFRSRVGHDQYITICVFSFGVALAFSRVVLNITLQFPDGRDVEEEAWGAGQNLFDLRGMGLNRLGHTTVFVQQYVNPSQCVSAFCFLGSF